MLSLKAFHFQILVKKRDQENLTGSFNPKKGNRAGSKRRWHNRPKSIFSIAKPIAKQPI